MAKTTRKAGGSTAASPPRARRSKKAAVAPASIGLAAPDTVGEKPGREVAELEAAVVADGGAVIGRYREPFGGHSVLVVARPIEKVEPTPYQRDASKTHVERLGAVVSKIGRYLDPIVAIRARDGLYWTPNGNHRLQAMRKIGAKSIIAL